MCDIVLKGGLTSGVVYPLALARLAKNFRFSNIGGTSAGAIAAAAAAAAEYGRQTGGGRGFARLEEIPGEIGPNLLALFQPTPLLKPVYDTFIALLNALPALAPIAAPVARYWLTTLIGLVPGIVVFLAGVAANSCGWVAFGVLLTLLGPVVALVGRVILAQPEPLAKSAQDTLTAAWNARGDIPKILAVLWTPLKGYWRTAAAGVVLGIIIVLFAKSCGWVAFGLLVALLGLIGAMVGRFVYAAGVELVDNDYGLCSGIRQPYSSDEAFTDWLTRLIDEAAGRSKGQDPLTFGDLANLRQRPDQPRDDDDEPDGGAALHAAVARLASPDGEPSAAADRGADGLGRAPPVRLQAQRMGEALSGPGHGVSAPQLPALHAAGRRER